MRLRVLVDTGPLYAAVDPHDQYHARAQRELCALEQSQTTAVLAYPILLEAYTLVLYRLGQPIAQRWVGEITAGTALLNPTPEDYNAARGRIQAFPDQSITLFDATLAILAGRLGVSVWSYDHHFDVMRVPVWR